MAILSPQHSCHWSDQLENGIFGAIDVERAGIPRWRAFELVRFGSNQKVGPLLYPFLRFGELVGRDRDRKVVATFNGGCLHEFDPCRPNRHNRRVWLSLNAEAENALVELCGFAERNSGGAAGSRASGSRSAAEARAAESAEPCPRLMAPSDQSREASREVSGLAPRQVAIPSSSNRCRCDQGFIWWALPGSNR